MCKRLGCGDLVKGKTDRQVHELWAQYMGRHTSLIGLRMHLHRVLPAIQIDSLLTHKEQRQLWACLQTWKARFD